LDQKDNIREIIKNNYIRINRENILEASSISTLPQSPEHCRHTPDAINCSFSVVLKLLTQEHTSSTLLGISLSSNTQATILQV
jgi:hypothetical protein